MPFKSAKQRKACYSSGGFGGKVNCKSYASKGHKPKKKK